jgi:hypothetical protein
VIDSASWRSGLRLLYLLGALIILEQASELVVAMIPTNLASPSWRFTAVSLAFGKVTPLLFADALIGMAAFGRGDWTFVRIWGWLHIAFAVVLAALLVAFGLDALTFRRVAGPERRPEIERLTIRAALVGAAVIVFAFRAGLVSARTGRVKSDTRGVAVPIVGIEPTK